MKSQINGWLYDIRWGGSLLCFILMTNADISTENIFFWKLSSNVFWWSNNVSFFFICLHVFFLGQCKQEKNWNPLRTTSQASTLSFRLFCWCWPNCCRVKKEEPSLSLFCVANKKQKLKAFVCFFPRVKRNTPPVSVFFSFSEVLDFFFFCFPPKLLLRIIKIQITI